MLYLVALSVLPLILVHAQDNTTATANSSASDSTAATSSGGSFTAPTVTDTTCGNKQQNFNQCVTKVAKDINACGTGNLCLCQTYANIAACYNACPDLDATKQGYTDQSASYCQQAGVKLNTTESAANTTAPTSTTTTSVNTSTPVTSPVVKTNTTSISSTTATSPNKTAASTFAAKSSASQMFISSGLLAATSAVVMSIVA